MAFKFH